MPVRTVTSTTDCPSIAITRVPTSAPYSGPIARVMTSRVRSAADAVEGTPVLGAEGSVSGLPFFVDPIDGRLKIEKGALVRIYREAQINAENNLRV